MPLEPPEEYTSACVSKSEQNDQGCSRSLGHIAGMLTTPAATIHSTMIAESEIVISNAMRGCNDVEIAGERKER